MSADNIIYVLELKDQYRVEYMGAPDNIVWSHIDGQVSFPVPSRIVEYFSKSPSFKDKEKAYAYAFKLYAKEGYVEYGVSPLYINRTWLQILKEAREEIRKEKLYVLSLSEEKMNSETKEQIIDDLNKTYSSILTHIVIYSRKGK